MTFVYQQLKSELKDTKRDLGLLKTDVKDGDDESLEKIEGKIPIL